MLESLPPTDPPTYIWKSEDMAELAKQHHERLQKALPATDADRSHKIRNVLHFPTPAIDPEHKVVLMPNITEDEICSAIRKLPNNVASGLDSIPYELLNSWSRSTKKVKRNKNPKAFNIARLLQIVYNDIEDFDTSEILQFTEGWMCLIDKKKGQ